MNFSCIRTIWNEYFSRGFTLLEWQAVKISFIVLWFRKMSRAFRKFEEAPYPHGICQYFDCTLVTSGLAGKVIFGLTMAVCLLYIFEKKMLFSTLYLFVISMIAFSLEQSNGFLLRNELFTAILFVQFLAYLIHHFRKEKEKLIRNRYQFAVQIVAAGYFLSALSKLKDSGLSWPMDAQYMPLQIYKSFHYIYSSFGETQYLDEGAAMSSWMIEHTIWLQLLCGGALFLEFFVFVALFSRTHMRAVGLLLLSMHIGIDIVMNIWIAAIVWPMIYFLVNPLYLILLIARPPGLWLKNAVFSSGKKETTHGT